MRLFPFNFLIIILFSFNNLWSQKYIDTPFFQDYSIDRFNIYLKLLTVVEKHVAMGKKIKN